MFKNFKFVSSINWIGLFLKFLVLIWQLANLNGPSQGKTKKKILKKNIHFFYPKRVYDKGVPGHPTHLPK